MYHTAMSPLVDRGLVIVHVGGHNDGALTAFDAASGDVKWSWNGDGPAYGSPIVTEITGVVSGNAFGAVPTCASS